MSLFYTGLGEIPKTPGGKDVDYLLYLIFGLLKMYLGQSWRERENRGRGRHRLPAEQGALLDSGPTPGPWDHDLRQRRTLSRLSHPSALLYLIFMGLFLDGDISSVIMYIIL